MKHQKHLDLFGNFPYKHVRGNQRDALDIISKANSSVTLELPTGTGKTAIGYTFLKSLEANGQGPLFYTTPTKALVDQTKRLHPSVKTVYGRNEYKCLYYKEEVSAEDAPCSMIECPHRVDQETGKVEEEGAIPCTYLHDKYLAKQGGIVTCTFAFYLFTRLFTKEWEEPAGLVIDEAHRIARVVRNSLSYEITDYHLKRSVKLLSEIDPKASRHLDNFLKKLMRIIRLKPLKTPTLLETYEIQDLMDDLSKISPRDLSRSIREAVRRGKINPEEEREVLKRLEVVTGNLSRYLRSLEFSLPSGERNPLNYTYASYEKVSGDERIKYRLVIKAYYVAPLIQKIISPKTLAYSATIGDSDIFGFETGIKSPFYAFSSEFPTKNARVFIPRDTPNLAVKVRSHREPTRVLRKVSRACKEFTDAGLRSLVVVVSNREREKFLMLCGEESVEAVSYGNGLAPREAVARFREGEGDVLVGTVANYGEGIDLPKNIAPVIFFLRPSFPPPTDPATLFEERRFRSRRWELWNWRVMIEALQVRGRNIRGAEDLGVTFFISQQFKRFIPAVLPKWLRESYKGGLSFEEAVEETKQLLGK